MCTPLHTILRKLGEFCFYLAKISPFYLILLLSCDWSNVHHDFTDTLYIQEALALLVNAIAAPATTLVLCDNQALVYAIRTGHGHAVPWPLYAALMVSFCKNDLKIK